jgi:hypothetical protein
MMSVKALGEAGTEYGIEAKHLSENDLEAHDSYGKPFNQRALTADIAKNGVKEPIQVQYDGDEEPGLRFSILNGHHRYVAARTAGHTHVPVEITAGNKVERDSSGKLVVSPGTLPKPHEL